MLSGIGTDICILVILPISKKSILLLIYTCMHAPPIIFSFVYSLRDAIIMQRVKVIICDNFTINEDLPFVMFVTCRGTSVKTFKTTNILVIILITKNW